MRIIDCNDKEREALSVKVVSHQIPDAIHGGIATTALYVEALIKGRHRKGTWTEWYLLEQFREKNPSIAI